MSEKRYSPCAMALGTFDGMHPGHLAVIDRAVNAAREMGAACRVYTFTENPRALLSKAPAQLMTPEERARAMRARGVDEVIMVRFTPALAQMPPEAFVRALRDQYQARALVAGEDYTFGRMAAGDAALLCELGNELGLQVIIVPMVMAVTKDGRAAGKVSSSRIRQALAENRPDVAEALLHGEPVEPLESGR